MKTFSEFLHAAAEVLRAIAWPSVVLIFAYQYRTKIGALFERLREARGVKFDPLPQTAGRERGNPVEELESMAPAVAGNVLPAANHLPPTIERFRSPVVIRSEVDLLATPEIAQIADPAMRVRALTTVAAALLVINWFERVESSIWASQIDLLQFLNSAPDGATREQLKERFYDRAVDRFPTWFHDYSFDEYLNFVSSQSLVNSGDTVTITEGGREYLVWRVQQRKSPKAFG